MKFYQYQEPIPDGFRVVTISRRDILKAMRRYVDVLLPHKWLELDDDKLVEDFLLTHWAWEAGENL